MNKTIVEDVTIYTWKDLKKELGKEKYKEFIDWLKGQTCLETGAYTWDYDRWKQ